jgi:hypothetical protein
MKTSPSDKLRAQCLELVADMTEHLKLVRDYATTPGDAWLARSELNKLNSAVSEMDLLLEEIKQADSSN